MKLLLEKLSKQNTLNILKVSLILGIFFIAIFQRFQYFDQVGKDIYAYERAIHDLFRGVNPYQWTIDSFSNPDDPGNHGFSYFPGLLYVNSFFYILSILVDVPFQYLWKIPVLLADIGVGILFVTYFRIKEHSKFLALIVALLLWYFNPYFFIKGNYVYFDPISIFLMLLGLKYLEKDDVLAGAFLALAVGFKTFPIILLSLFLLKAKKMYKMFFSMIMIGVFLSLPFMFNLEDFQTYLNGTLFVHNERFVQGRPFLFYISYFYDIEFFQIVPLKLYSILAIVSGWVFAVSAYLITRFTRFEFFNKYVVATAAFMLFYLFTPVLNRTYLIWAIPIFVFGFYELLSYRKHVLYYLVCFFYWGFYYWYLVQWKDGFHIWRP